MPNEYDTFEEWLHNEVENYQDLTQQQLDAYKELYNEYHDLYMEYGETTQHTVSQSNIDEMNQQLADN